MDQIQIRRLSSASQRREVLVLILLAALSTLFASGLMFKRATTPWARLPDNDYWWNIAGVITEQGVRFDLPALLLHNNEHIVVIPKLIYAVNYLLTSGSNIGLIAYSIVVGAICSGLLVLLSARALIKTPLRLAVCALLFPLIMLSTKLTHSYFLGMSGAIWLTADLFVVLSLAALARAVATKASIWLLLSLVSALLGVLTYSTAVYALLVLLAVSFAALLYPPLERIFPKPTLVATIVVSVLVLTTLLIYRSHPPGHPSLSFDPLQLVLFVLIYLGNALPLPTVLHPIGGLALLCAGAFSLWCLLKLGREEADLLFWTCLFLFGPFNALMTGVGRLGYGVAKAEISRYQSVAALSLIATITLVLMALPKGEVARPIALARGAIIIALFLSAPLIVLNPQNLSGYTARNEQKALAEIALRFGIQGDQHLRASTSAPGQLDALLPVLRDARHVPFDDGSRCEQMIGQTVAPAVEAAAGSIEVMTSYGMSHGGGLAVELSGWSERGGAAADCVIVVDQDQHVIGAGTSISRRPDVENMKGRSLGLVGWKAVAFMPKGNVCVLAAFPYDERWFSLGACKSEAWSRSS